LSVLECRRDDPANQVRGADSAAFAGNRVFGGLQSAEAMVERVAEQRSDDWRLLVVDPADAEHRPS
jgi:hypothetical protein